MSYSSNPTNPSSFPFSESNLKIPSTNYHHTTSIGRTSETSSNTTNYVQVATIELQIQGWYKLYVEPLKGFPPMNIENDFFVAPKFNYKFKVPLFNPTNTLLYVSYVSKELAKLPMSRDLVMYLQPHIVNNVVSLAQREPTTEFKVVFDVKVVKIELADYRECDGYRRRRLLRRN